MHLTPSMGHGGIEHIIASLAIQLKKSYRTSVCCLDNIGHVGDILRDQKKVEVFCLDRKPGTDYRLIYNLARLLKDKSIDILHMHNEAALFYGAISAFIARTPVTIATEHSRHFIDEKPIRSIEKHCMSWLVDQIVCVSDELKEKSISMDKVKRTKLRTIMNGVNVQFIASKRLLSTKVRLELGILEQQVVIGTVARLHPVKNQHLLLHAFAKLCADGMDSRLMFVGDGPLRRNLQELAHLLQVNEKVIFLGNRSDIAELLAAMDIFVLCSFTEGVPLTILEAMSAGLPVIATNVGVNSKLITNGQNGIIVPSNDLESLQEAICALMKDSHLRQRMGQKALKKAIQNFDQKNMIANYDSLYSSLLRKGHEVSYPPADALL